jgi:hypothetical protein
VRLATSSGVPEDDAIGEPTEAGLLGRAESDLADRLFVEGGYEIVMVRSLIRIPLAFRQVLQVSSHKELKIRDHDADDAARLQNAADLAEKQYCDIPVEVLEEMGGIHRIDAGVLEWDSLREIVGEYVVADIAKPFSSLMR